MVEELNTRRGPAQSWLAFWLLYFVLTTISWGVASIARATRNQTEMATCIQMLKIGVPDPDVCDDVTPKDEAND